MKTRRTQAERRQQSEQGLLVAAAEVILEHGYNGATFDRISERAGYSRGLVTLRFGSKDGLVAAMIEFLGSRLEEAYADRLKEARTGRQKLVDFVDVFVLRLEDDRLANAYFVLLAGALGNVLPQSHYFLEQHEAVKLRLAAFVREGMEDGTIMPGIDPVVAATALGCFQLGLAMQHLLDPQMSVGDMRQFVRIFAGRH
ncbi:TetR/AcrR family transcriptional regulator [Novosphingobium sp. KCTC 2891]|uniref:TetR/AcrR family transcriptional regulator n=1 Tax=Novosphingobium sp. KCTC 2891 TaxID=2989730 RepID=UPI0022218464|nr:TetR/AcrR family transcriptional regulator [Novosphingobium sp. KCTC 2891]MCW1383424.1 TetR/AcrR family transcriptional regulator [Novosphingobium sp. KCTC 2891]